MRDDFRCEFKFNQMQNILTNFVNFMITSTASKVNKMSFNKNRDRSVTFLVSMADKHFSNGENRYSNE